MPTTYTHYRFGQDVYKRLPLNIRKSIDESPDLYNIGVHGPDILFYYHPLSKNEITQRGNAMHDESAIAFFERCRTRLKRNFRASKSLAYVLGFMTHFMLDSECHPFVGKWIEESGVSHLEIEMEFDRMLLLRDDLDPFAYQVTQHIHATSENAKEISKFWEGTSEKQIKKTLSQMKFYCELLHCKKPMRTVLNAGLKLAVQKTADLMIEFYNKLYSREPLNSRFDRTYEGIRQEGEK